MLTSLKLKLGSKLVLISILCVVPVMILAGIVLERRVESIIFKQINASLDNNLQFAADQIQREIFHLQNTATVIATDQNIRRSLDTYNSVGLNVRLNRIAAVYPQLNYILLLDDTKSVFAVSTINGSKIKMPSESIMGESVTSHLINPEFHQTDPTYSAPGSDPYLKLFNLNDQFSQWFAAPVLVRGNAKGWIVLSYQFQSTMTALQDELVSRLTDQGFPALSSHISNMQHQIIAGKQDQNKNDTNVLAQRLSLSIGPSNFLLNIHFKKDDVLNALTKLRSLMLLAFIPMIFMLVAGLYVAIRKTLLKPIQQLDEGASQYAQGLLEYHIPDTGHDEIAHLARSFNHMGEKIADAKNNLERQVKERTQQAEEAYNRLQAIVDSAADCIITSDLQGNITSFNKAAESIFGYSSKDIINKPFQTLMPTEFAQPYNESFQQYLQTGRSSIIGSSCELQGQKRNGDTFPIHLAISEVKTNGDTLLTAIIRDISLTKQTQNALIEAKEAAENAARYKSEFLASMSHEIRTPMNGVLGMLGLLLRSQLDGEQRHRTKLAHSSAKSLLTIINDILDFSKIEAGKLELEILDFNICNLLGDIAEEMGHRAQEKNIELILDVAQVQQSMVQGDPGRIRQILSNLVGNAIKFTHEGEIVIRTNLSTINENDLQFNCTIEDTGVGIPAKKLPTLFESFTQVDASTTREYGGTGLGLAIVKQLCELMDGDITVSSEVNKGSQFQFRVMLHKSDQAERILPKVDIKGVPILVVDDNATNREVLTAQLQLWGAVVTEAEDAESAIQVMDQRSNHITSPAFTIAFLDMQMPKMDGADLGKAIRNDARYNATKLVMMTSIGGRGDVKRFQELGFNAYFPKPITMSDLFDALNVVIACDDAMDNTNPMITHHYLKSLKRSDVDSNNIINPVNYGWPDNCRILLVEDNQVNQTVAMGILEEFGLQCDVAGNGLEALYALNHAPHNAPYHLVFMDCQMPEMDGYEAARQIRNKATSVAYCHIPIIAMTANAMKGDKEKCLDAGMSDYLSKPIEVEDVEDMLRKWLIGDSKNAEKPELQQKDTHDDQNETDSRAPNMIWDKSSALKRVSGKDERLLLLIQIFLDDIPNHIKQLRQAIESDDMAEGEMAAHAIKGVTGNLSALSVTDIAKEIEFACKEGDQNRVKELWPKFYHHYKELDACFREFLREKITLA